jgi:hypothetical protein
MICFRQWFFSNVRLRLMRATIDPMGTAAGQPAMNPIISQKILKMGGGTYQVHEA